MSTGMGASLLADVKGIQNQQAMQARQKANDEAAAKENERHAGVDAANAYKAEGLKAIEEKIKTSVAKGDSRDRDNPGSHRVVCRPKDFKEPKGLGNVGREAFIYRLGELAKEALAPQFQVKWDGVFDIGDSGNGDGGYWVTEPEIIITWRG